MAEKYICSISMMLANKKLLVAGTEFEKKDIEIAKFEHLQRQGYITPAGQPEKPKELGMRELVSRPEVQNPAPIKKAVTPKVVELKQTSVDSIWNVDPEQIKDLSFEVLMASYIDTCEKYGITPVKFKDKKEVIVQLTSQFVKAK